MANPSLKRSAKTKPPGPGLRYGVNFLSSGLASSRRLPPSSNVRVRRGKALSSSGCESRPATFAPAGSNRSNRGGNEAIEAFGVEGPSRDLAIVQAVTRVNVEQASKRAMRKPTRP